MFSFQIQQQVTIIFSPPSPKIVQQQVTIISQTYQLVATLILCILNPQRSKDIYSVSTTFHL